METPYSFAGQQSVISPQLVYYPELIAQNIAKMISIAGGAQRLWPHIKTHKSAHVVKMQLAAGITRFKCATIAEAEMAAGCGAEHLVLAYPLVGPNIERFFALAAAFPGTEFFAIADDTHQVELLSAAACAHGAKANLLMDFDMGQHRTGVVPERAVAMYQRWARLPGIEMRGMHCYDGHRHETNLEVRCREVCKADDIALAVKNALQTDGLDCSILIMGGTPSFPIHAAYTGEYLSPGTCVIQDFGYREAYPDMDFVPAAAVLTRVVSRPSEDTFTLDMGTKAVASDPAPERAEISGMEYARTVLQNEEHWVVKVPPEHIADIPPIGSELFAIPSHICPTSALYPEVAVAENGSLSGYWPVDARNRKITI